MCSRYRYFCFSAKIFLRRLYLLLSARKINFLYRDKYSLKKLELGAKGKAHRWNLPCYFCYCQYCVLIELFFLWNCKKNKFMVSIIMLRNKIWGIKSLLSSFITNLTETRSPLTKWASYFILVRLAIPSSIYTA